MSVKDLAAAIASETSPCDRFKCGNRKRCAQHRLACVAFVGWVEDGSTVAPDGSKRSRTRPTHELYVEAMGDVQPTERAALTAQTKAKSRADETVAGGLSSLPDLQRVWA